MIPAGYILTGQRRFTERMHPPMVIAHGLTSEFFGLEEHAAPYPDFHSFHVWPATAAVLDQLRAVDHLAGQNCLDEFSCWQDPATRRMVICTGQERAYELGASSSCKGNSCC